MDFTLKCNHLQCRQDLNERAVVTTCSHIFCLQHAPEGECPACHTPLLNKDDAAETLLNPTEDYKTSILSGLSPTIIMECAGRGLAFYSYQVTQEVVYQEYLAKGVTDKNAVLNTQMDQIINDANAEILRLRNKLSGLELEQEDLRKKNHELFEAYNQKSQAHQKSQKMFDALKKRTLQSDVRNAVDDVDNTQGHIIHGHASQNLESFTNSQRQRQQYPLDNRGIEQLHSRQRGGSSGEDDNTAHNSKAFQKPRAIYGQPWNGQSASQNSLGSSQAQQRTRVPTAIPQGDRHTQYGLTPVRGESQNRILTQTPQATRQPLGGLNNNVGYGMPTGYGLGTASKAKLHRAPLFAPSFSNRQV